MAVTLAEVSLAEAENWTGEVTVEPEAGAQMWTVLLVDDNEHCATPKAPRANVSTVTENRREKPGIDKAAAPNADGCQL